jgi:monofunctional biosynthetic peptidoglycan transglycosylase
MCKFKKDKFALFFLLFLRPEIHDGMDDTVNSEVTIVNEEPQPEVKKKKILKKALTILKWIAIAYLSFTLFLVILFSFVNPPVTPLMIKRVIEQKAEGKKVMLKKKWMPLKKISPYMVKAVVASEDNRFLDHWGIDLDAIQKAVEYNKRHKRKHGASTITQQVAKNLFLWPARTYLRKGFELYFTVLIETIWSKKRIMTVYLNIIETGDGLYGTEAAANKYFHKTSAQLTQGEAALIAAALPNPRRRNPATPTAYMLKRQNRIISLMNKIGDVKFK